MIMIFHQTEWITLWCHVKIILLDRYTLYQFNELVNMILIFDSFFEKNDV